VSEEPEMYVVILQALGWLIFTTSTIILGARLRRNPSKRNAQRTSRILHLLFWMGVIPPTGFGVFIPGLTHYDEALGLSPLPPHPLILGFGVLGLVVGVYLLVVSNVALRHSGKGAHAFRLTKRLVIGGIYGQVRNPMSLGFYLVSVGFGLLLRSTYLTLGAMLFVIPVHVFYLKYFEEYELELRMGQSYLDYKRGVPFLLPRWISRWSGDRLR
jgi:protein-S-isoprenylcysteine O-methyltransferase Ste14